MGVFHDKFTREQCLKRPKKYRWRCMKHKNGKNMCRCAPKKCRGTPSYGEVYAIKLKGQAIVWRCPRLPAYCGYGEPKCIYKSNNKKKWRCPACAIKTCPEGKDRFCTPLKMFKNYHKCVCIRTPEPSSSPTSSPSHSPSKSPSGSPSKSPSKSPSVSPSKSPSSIPSEEPSAPPTEKPTDSPTGSPSNHPSKKPSGKPSQRPSRPPTPAPTICRDLGQNLDYGDISLCTGWVLLNPEKRCPMTVNLKFAREYCPYSCRVCRGGEKY